MSAIRFEHVYKSYENQVVLSDFSLEVREAETKVILGGSGSGKSTLLKMVLGLVKPDSGRVMVQGVDVSQLSETELSPIRRQIGMVFQESALFDFLTVGENVAYRMREDGELPVSEIESIVRQVLGFVGLEDAIEKMTSELSGGMKRRVGIARAIVGGPRILLYDEPTAGLDPITARTICDLVIKLRDLEEVASIFVTHDLNSAMNLANDFATLEESGQITFRTEDDQFCLINTSFAILKDGRLLFEGSDDELRASDNEYIREFLT